jgi:hypothetical protein
VRGLDPAGRRPVLLKPVPLDLRVEGFAEGVVIAFVGHNESPYGLVTDLDVLDRHRLAVPGEHPRFAKRHWCLNRR